MGCVSEEFSKKLLEVSTSQKRILSLSDYFVKNSNECEILVEQWFDCFCTCQSAEKRLALLYVANEAITKNPKSLRGYLTSLKPDIKIPETEEIERIFEALEKPPSCNSAMRQSIADEGEAFQDPASLLKPYFQLILHPSYSSKDILTLDEEIDVLLKKLQHLEEILNNYCSDLQKETTSRKELECILMNIENHFMSFLNIFNLLVIKKKNVSKLVQYKNRK
ncbi:hypothetical protein MXB_90 [Myxobolus squamalis]|nr:hypothetical protein MXB_90 [Myxobolus squamalis]